MTAAQQLQQRDGGDAKEPSWKNAPAPAQVARKVLRLGGFDPPPTWIPFLTNALHWGYGTAWGALYTLARGNRASGTIREGLAFGVAVWGASYAELVPLGIYKPPWEYPARMLGSDVGFHLAYGIGVVTAADALGFHGR